MRSLLLLFLLSPSHAAESPQCVCTCVVKVEEGYSTRKGSGADREAAGEDLKKKLGKKKCEISPDCKGTC